MMPDTEVDRIEQTITEMITSLELAPGDVVSLSELTQRLDCGRTPLRLALERLTEQGLVVSVPNRGILIAPLSLDEFAEAYEFAIAVEGFAARLAAERISQEELARLEDILAELREGTLDYRRSIVLDKVFHLTIANATRNRFATQAAIELYNLLQRYFESRADMMNHSEQTSWSIMVEELQAIVAALKNRDGAEAERRMRAHELAAKERVKSSL
jgi:DNA-binding GntR family transcriptional regulator